MLLLCKPVNPHSITYSVIQKSRFVLRTIFVLLCLDRSLPLELLLLLCADDKMSTSLILGKSEPE